MWLSIISRICAVSDGGVLLRPVSLHASPAFLPDGDDGSEVGQFQKEVEALPPELRHYIQEDNWRLEQEAEEWEEEQSCKIPQMEPSPASESQDLSSESGPGNATSQFANRVETGSSQLVKNTAVSEPCINF